MARKSKRVKEIEKLIEEKENFTIEEAIDILKKCPTTKFDQTVEVSLKMGVDPKKPEQQVRGSLLLPKGSGKKIKILVIAKADKKEEAKRAKADFVGYEEILEKIKNGWIDFDVIIATPDVMRDVGKLGKVLGPRGLMPSPKSGTVTNDIEKTIKELKAGKIEFKLDKNASINSYLGKLSFKKEELKQNIEAFIRAINKAKPSSAKGVYIKSFYISSTMGPGLKINVN